MKTCVGTLPSIRESSEKIELFLRSVNIIDVVEAAVPAASTTVASYVYCLENVPVVVLVGQVKVKAVESTFLVYPLFRPAENP